MNDDVEVLSILDEEQEELDTKKDKKHTLKKKQKMPWYTKLLIVIDFLALAGFFLMYGPFRMVRDFYVSSALTSMTHGYLAYVFYTPARVKEIASQNVVIENDESSDTSAIKISEIKDDGVYESVYEEQILKKDPNNDVFKVITINEKTYTAYITVVYDPSRVHLVSASNLSSGGQRVTEIAKKHNALVAINGGSAKIRNHALIPRGIYIQDGKVIFDSGDREKLIAFNNDNILVLAKMNSKEAKAQGIRDAVWFKPYLIVNGVPSQFKGDGGYGNRPRTAIGQRQDGIVLFVTVDGKTGLNGTTMKELTKIFVRYKAYNAANLDGGGSTTLVVNGKLINDPTGWQQTNARHVANAWIVK